MVATLLYLNPQPAWGCGLEISLCLWALTDSNRRPSACKADALNQLS